jgi:hypothetical protein
MSDEAKLDKGAKMQNEEARLETEEEDVEAHAAAEPRLEPRLRSDDSDDDVEAHGALREPKL